MMKTCYKANYDRFCPTKNEQFYEGQARQGLLLQKRGFFFSKFIKGDPQEMTYRLLYTSTASLSPETQEKYRALGWDCIEGRNYTHVLASHKEKNLPPVYESTQAIADALEPQKRRPRPADILLLCNLLLIRQNLASSQTVSRLYELSFMNKWKLSLLTQTPAHIVLILSVVFLFVELIGNALLFRNVRRNLIAGTVPEKTKNGVFTAIRIVLFASVLLFAGLTIGYAAQDEQTTFPEQSDGYYLDIQDLDLDDEWKLDYDSSVLKKSSSLLTDSTYARMEIMSDSDSFLLVQSVFEVRTKNACDFLAKALMEEGVGYEEVPYDGLEKLYCGANDCIAISGNIVYKITIWGDCRVDIPGAILMKTA